MMGRIVRLGTRRAIAAAIAAAFVAATGCNSPVLTQGPRLAKTQALRVQLDDQPQSLDPGQSQYPFETAVLRLIDEPLLRPSNDLSGVVPAAASSYEVDSGGTRWTFHLRHDAKYWDGQAVKAQDFVFAWRRLMDPRLSAPTATFFANTIFNGDKVALLDPQRDATRIDAGLQSLGLAASDDYTFQVNLTRPDPAFIWIAAMPSGSPIRQDVVTANGDQWSGSPETLLSNGPFKVSEMVANDHLTLVPNPDYWGPKPELKTITYEIVNDGAAALAKFRNGELDVLDVKPAQAAVVAADSQLLRELVKTPALTTWWIAFRVTSPRLASSRVRLALAQAIDRDALVKQVFQGQAQPVDTFIPQGMQGYAPELGDAQKFDVAQARATLASAGVSAAQLNGLKFSYDRNSDFSQATATFVRDQLKTNLGVTIALDPLDPNTLGSRLGNGTFEIAGPFGWTADYPDPADWFSIFETTNSNDDSLYQNGRYDSLVGVASTDLQAARRQQEYREAQRLLLNDAPAAFLAQALSWHLVQPYVKGLTANAVEDWPGELAPATIYITDH